MPQTVFVSYAREDAEFALGLASALREAGAPVWLDQLDIAAGDHWDRSVEEALRTSPTLLLVLSPSSVASTNVMDEVSFALEEGKRVVPVLHRPCRLPFRLRRLQYVDLSGGLDRDLGPLIAALGLPASSEPQAVHASLSRPPSDDALRRPAADATQDGHPETGRGTPWRAVLLALAAIGLAAGVALLLHPIGGGGKTIDGLELPAYVITDSAFAEKARAQRRLVELNHAGYSNIGFFWIPNFEYLSGEPLYQVYVGPFRHREEAVRAICDYNRRMNRKAYGILVSTRPGREEFRCDD